MTVIPDQLWEFRRKRLCHNCVGDDILRCWISTEGLYLKCDYCGDLRKSIELQEFANRIVAAVEGSFDPLSSIESIVDCLSPNESASMRELFRQKAESIIGIISKYAKVEAEPAKDIQKLMEATYPDGHTPHLASETYCFDEGEEYILQAKPDCTVENQWKQLARIIREG